MVLVLLAADHLHVLAVLPVVHGRGRHADLFVLDLEDGVGVGINEASVASALSHHMRRRRRRRR